MIKRTHKKAGRAVNVREALSRYAKRRCIEKQEICDGFVIADTRKEFDILCKTLGAEEPEAVERRSRYEAGPYTNRIVIGRLLSDPEKDGKSCRFDMQNGDQEGSSITVKVTSKLCDIVMEHLAKGMLCCIEGKPTQEGITATHVVLLSSKSRSESVIPKTEKVHKVSSICKATANEGDGCTYKVSCITREHSATRKKYSGEFDSLNEAMKLCAMAYNAGVDVCVECVDAKGESKSCAKIYTKTKEFEDFTDDGIATKAFREAMMWSQSPQRKKADEDIAEVSVPDAITVDISDAENIGSSDINEIERTDTDLDGAVTESDTSLCDEDQCGIAAYARQHHAIIATEARVNGTRIRRLVTSSAQKRM